MTINLRVDDVFINHDHPSRRWHASVVDEKLGLVAVTYGETKEEATALAAMIVHSVSSHDVLLGACTLAHDIEMVATQGQERQLRERYRERLREAVRRGVPSIATPADKP